jgi:MYXO-CTERM domain-containing protein
MPPRPAQAIATFTGNGLGFSIPDNNPAGAFSDIVVADNFLISDITVSLNTLTHIDTNTTVDLFRPVSYPAATFGDGSNFNGTYSFNDAFTGVLWSAAQPVAGSVDIPGGDYFPTGAASAAKVPMLTTISGLPSSGIWRLSISDVERSFIGALGGWTLNLQGSGSTPVPGPLPLLGAGAAFGWSRRLRKRCRAAL